MKEAMEIMEKKTHRNAGAATGARTIDSPVGRLHLAATDAGLTHILFLAEGERRPPRQGSAPAARILDAAQRQLGEYFAGRRREFDVPLAPSGTAFQELVWRTLLDVPFGRTTSYGELARRMGRPAAVRAVGAANGANPIPIIVPCHRVIGANGTLVGYGGGLEIKRRLLALETSLAFTDR